MFSTRACGKDPGKDSDAGNDWGQEEKGRLEDEMVGWHHQLNGQAFEQTLGDREGQGSLAGCSSWGHKESDMTEQQENVFFKAWFWAMDLNIQLYLDTLHPSPPPSPWHLTGFKTKVIVFPWNQGNHCSLIAWTRSSSPSCLPTSPFSCPSTSSWIETWTQPLHPTSPSLYSITGWSLNSSSNPWLHPLPINTETWFMHSLFTHYLESTAFCGTKRWQGTRHVVPAFMRFTVQLWGGSKRGKKQS